MSRKIRLPDQLPMMGSLPRELPPSVEHLLDTSAVERIVSETNANKAPVGLSLEDLRIDLSWCRVRYNSLTQHASDKLARDHVRHLKRIAKAAKSLRDLCKGDFISVWARDSILLALPPGEQSNVLTGIDKIREVAEALSKDPPSAIYEISRSPAEWLIAGPLSEVFEMHFKRPVSIARPATGGKANSTFIRFAVSALKEMQIQTPRGLAYQPETIARAVTSVRSGKVRRART
jgi:hypothetical protein